MNIRCPQCQTVFKVDPSRIPQGGARARCARCGSRFMVRPPPTRPDAGTAPAPKPQPRNEARQQPATPSNGSAGRPERPEAAPAAVADPAGQAPAGAQPLGSKDPNARAERLARALVSDIVAYHPDRRERSLSDGTLRTEFREEIMKSWDEYVAQVGMNMARSTPYFRDALNKILAKGQQLF